MNISRITTILVGLCLLLPFAGKSQEQGIASYYHDALTGLRMANGDRYDPGELTCAHPTLPMGSILKVARTDNPEYSVMVTVTDRGPFVRGRIVDLSRRAAAELGILHHGIMEVVIAVVRKPKEKKGGR